MRAVEGAAAAAAGGRASSAGRLYGMARGPDVELSPMHTGTTPMNGDELETVARKIAFESTFASINPFFSSSWVFPDNHDH